MRMRVLTGALWVWGAAVTAHAAHPVGLAEQPCASSPAAPATADGRDWRERILDPNAGREFEPPDAAALAAMHAADEERLHSDWPSLCRYRTDNAALRRPGAQRVVSWATRSPSCGSRRIRTSSAKMSSIAA